MGSLTGAVAS